MFVGEFKIKTMKKILIIYLILIQSFSIKSQFGMSSKSDFSKFKTYYLKSIKTANKVDVSKPNRNLFLTGYSSSIILFIEPLNENELNDFNLQIDSAEYYLNKEIKAGNQIINGHKLKEEVSNLLLYKRHINKLSGRIKSKSQIELFDFTKLWVQSVLSQSPVNATIITKNPFEFLQLEYEIKKKNNKKKLNLVYKPALDQTKYRSEIFDSKLNIELTNQKVKPLKNLGPYGQDTVSIDSAIHLINNKGGKLAITKVGHIYFKINDNLFRSGLIENSINLSDILLLELVQNAESPIVLTYEDPILVKVPYERNVFSFTINDSSYVKYLENKELMKYHLKDMVISNRERKYGSDLVAMYMHQLFKKNDAKLYEYFLDEIYKNEYLRISDKYPTELLQLFCNYRDNENILNFFRDDMNIKKIKEDYLTSFTINIELVNSIKSILKERNIRISKVRFLLEKDNKIGVWSINPQFYIEPQYDKVVPLKNCLISIRNEKLGIISGFGKELVTPQCDSIKEFYGGYYLYKENKVALYKTINNFVSPFDYEDISRLNYYHYLVKKDGKYGVAKDDLFKGFHLVQDCSCDSVKIKDSKDDKYHMKKEIEIECIKK